MAIKTLNFKREISVIGLGPECLRLNTVSNFSVTIVNFTIIIFLLVSMAASKVKLEAHEGRQRLPKS